MLWQTTLPAYLIGNSNSDLSGCYLVKVQPVALDHDQLPLFTQVRKIYILMIRFGWVQCSSRYSAGNIEEDHGVR